MLKPEEIDNFFQETQSRHTKTKMSSHSRYVLLAKLLLPAVAAVLATTLLVWPTLKKDISEFKIDFDIKKGDIEKLSVNKTTIYITDKNNRVNNLAAEKINEISAGSQTFSLTTPEAILPLSNDEWLSIKSPDGIFTQKTSLLQLKNTVELFYSRGLNIQTDQIFFDFKTSEGHSESAVSGEGFLGTINSERFEFSGKTNILTFLGKTTIVINEETLRKE